MIQRFIRLSLYLSLLFLSRCSRSRCRFTVSFFYPFCYSFPETVLLFFRGHSFYTLTFFIDFILFSSFYSPLSVFLKGPSFFPIECLSFFLSFIISHTLFFSLNFQSHLSFSFLLCALRQSYFNLSFSKLFPFELFPPFILFVASFCY